jgi:hypothetical protein
LEPTIMGGCLCQQGLRCIGHRTVYRGAQPQEIVAFQGAVVQRLVRFEQGVGRGRAQWCHAAIGAQHGVELVARRSASSSWTGR